MPKPQVHDPDAEIKLEIRALVPAAAFRSEPFRALLIFPYLGLLAGSSLYLARADLAWPLATLLALALGVAYSSFFFFGHEISHGAAVKSRRLQLVLSYAPFAIVCLSPRLWRVWHNRAHHPNANINDVDPDCWGPVELFEGDLARRVIFRLHPGSGHWFSLFYLPCFFTLHTQLVLWRKRKQHSFGHVPLAAPATETVLVAVLWIAIAIVSGGRWIYVVLLPMIVTNAIIMSYIATNHMLRPNSQDGDSLAATMSVRTLRVLDLIHHNFSHHTEHHLFPAMPTRHAPLVRRALQKLAPERYFAPPHWLALVLLYRTPRLYDGVEGFADPAMGRRVRMAEVEAIMRAGRLRPSRETEVSERWPSRAR